MFGVEKPGPSVDKLGIDFDVIGYMRAVTP
jgi:hypothetical protein